MAIDQQPVAPVKRPNWLMRHKVLTGLGAFVLVAGIAGGASGGSPTPEAPSSASSTSSTQKEETKSEPTVEDTKTEPTVEEPAEPAKPSTTKSQDNAVRQAESYLDMSAFSRTGLIKQLEFEGYSKADATYGAEHAGADWGVQAEKKAAEYLEMSAFSRSGLIEQLEFEGFTAAQARRGATAAGL